MTRALLVHPVFLADEAFASEAGSPYFPLGILYLAGYAREHGHQIDVFDGTFSDGVESFDAAMASTQPDVVAISVVIATESSALQIAERAKTAGAATVLGGPDPTASPGVYAAHPAVDLVVHHEGGQTFTRLLDLADDGPLTIARFHGEPGIAFADGGTVIINPNRPPIADLDALPRPARDLIDMETYLEHWRLTKGYTSMPISSTRGCVSNCQWCAEGVHGHGLRQRSPESLAAEVAELADAFDIDRLRLIDDVDALDRSWLESWADELRAIGAAVPYEALSELTRTDLPLLDVADSL